jgi:AcrR family transcriptional regulator
MARISKDPSVRMNEILDAAENLFCTKGYDETSVSDIVKAIEVTQGTFYNYFSSKEAVLEALANRHLSRIYGEIENITYSVRIPPNKFELVVYSIFISLRKNDGWMFNYLAHGHIHILDKFFRLAHMKFAPLFKKILDEGNEFGYFKVSLPYDVLDFISAILACICHSLYQNLSAEELRRRLEIAEKMISIALGVEKEPLHLMVLLV